MFVSNTYIVSLLLAIMTMVTWGTNKIAVKYLTYPVSLYTIDFFTWVFIFHTILSLTLGAGWFPGDPDDAFRNIWAILKQEPMLIVKKIGGPIVAGVTTMGFTLIMFVLVDGYGLTSAIPLLFGSSMVLGVIITYLMNPSESKPIYIFTGVAVLLLAVVINTIASNLNQKCQQKRKEQKAAEEQISSAPSNEVNAPLLDNHDSAIPVETTSQQSAVVQIAQPEVKQDKVLSMCAFVSLGLLAAFFDVFYAPCTALGEVEPIPISPYGLFEIVSFASFISVFPFTYIVMRHPLKGDKCTYSDWFHATWKQRWPAIWSACLLALGNFGYASAGHHLGFAVGYALSRGTLLVSALLGVVVYKEFKGADCKTWFLQITALVMFLGAIFIEAMASNKA